MFIYYRSGATIDKVNILKANEDYHDQNSFLKDKLLLQSL